VLQLLEKIFIELVAKGEQLFLPSGFSDQLLYLAEIFGISRKDRKCCIGRQGIG
jgi:hypothetical protein